MLILITANSKSKRTGKLILLLAIAQVTTLCRQFKVLQNVSFCFLSKYSNCEKQCFCYPGEIWKCTAENHNQNTVSNTSLESPKCRDHYCVQSACEALARIINANEVQFYKTSWESWQGMEHLQRLQPILKSWKIRNLSMVTQAVMLTKNPSFFENNYWLDTWWDAHGQSRSRFALGTHGVLPVGSDARCPCRWTRQEENTGDRRTYRERKYRATDFSASCGSLWDPSWSWPAPWDFHFLTCQSFAISTSIT